MHIKLHFNLQTHYFHCNLAISLGNLWWILPVHPHTYISFRQQPKFVLYSWLRLLSSLFFFFFLEFHHFRHYLTINIWISSKNQKAFPNTWFQYINSFWCSRLSLIPCLQPWRCIRIFKSVSETDVGHCHGLSHHRVPRRIVHGKYERGHIWRSSDISSKGTLQVDIPTNPGIHEPWAMGWHSKCVISHALPCDIETISLIISIRTKNNARDSWKTFFVLRLDYLRSFVNIVLIFFKKKKTNLCTKQKEEKSLQANKKCGEAMEIRNGLKC